MLNERLIENFNVDSKRKIFALSFQLCLCFIQNIKKFIIILKFQYFQKCEINMLRNHFDEK